MAFEPLNFIGGTIWGVVSAPFRWIGDTLGGAFSGGLWGGIMGGALAVVGPYALPYIQGMIPGLENVGWLTQASQYMATHSFVERLAFLGLGGAGVGAAAGATLSTVSSLSNILGEAPEYENPNTPQEERVVGVQDGQKLGLAVGTGVTAALGAVLAVGALRRAGIIGGEDVHAPVTPTAPDVSEPSVGRDDI